MLLSYILLIIFLTINISLSSKVEVEVEGRGRGQVACQSWPIQWTWMDGQPNQAISIAEPSLLPGARSGHAIATSPNKQYIYYFGGEISGVGLMNDLWIWDNSRNGWIFTVGSQFGNRSTDYTSAQPQPGGRKDFAVWALDDGFVIFGGFGFSSSPGGPAFLSDVWKYDVINRRWINLFRPTGNGYNNEFLFVSPSLPLTPGARQYGSSWVSPSDQSQLYFFGGRYRGPIADWNFMSDLWVFDLTRNAWSWAGGSQFNRAELVASGPGAWPSGRQLAVAWIGPEGFAYIYGGYGVTNVSNAIAGRINDLWKFDMANNLWTRVSGNAILDSATTATLPAGRSGSVVWSACGRFYMFGGLINHPSAGYPVAVNDVWRFNYITSTWAHMSSPVWGGTWGKLSVYVSQGTPDYCAYPSSRDGPAAWATDSGTLWFQGGKGYLGPSVRTDYDYVNDMWRLSVPPEDPTTCPDYTTTPVPTTTPPPIVTSADVVITTTPVPVAGGSFPIAAVVVPLLLLLLLLILLAVFLYRRYRAPNRGVFYVGPEESHEWGRNPFHRTNQFESHLDMAEVMDRPVASPVALSGSGAAALAGATASVSSAGSSRNAAAESPAFASPASAPPASAPPASLSPPADPQPAEAGEWEDNSVYDDFL